MRKISTFDDVYARDTENRFILVRDFQRGFRKI